MTLIELLVVVVILATVAGIATWAYSGSIERAEADVTRLNLEAVRSAILGTGASGLGQGFVPDAGRPPSTISELLVRPSDVDVEFDPVTKRGWRGPYLRAITVPYTHDPTLAFTGLFRPLYGVEDAPVPLDGWRRHEDSAGREWASPLVLQIPTESGGSEPGAEDARYLRVVSAGENGILETPPDEIWPPHSRCGDDLLLYVFVADERVDDVP